MSLPRLATGEKLLGHLETSAAKKIATRKESAKLTFADEITAGSALTVGRDSWADLASANKGSTAFAIGLTALDIFSSSLLWSQQMEITAKALLFVSGVI